MIGSPLSGLPDRRSECNGEEKKWKDKFAGHGPSPFAPYLLARLFALRLIVLWRGA